MIQHKITFGIDRKEITHFTSIELHQTINDHHTFTIKVPHSVVEKPRAYTLENAQKWMGKTVHIALENKNNFLGIVDDIAIDFNLDHVGSQIIISGYSKTVLLESGPKMHSWEDTSLQDMVREVIKSAANEQLQNDIQPEFTHKIDYQTQYAETDFQYLQRLAKTYNEWLYYDGEKLFFGKPKNLKQKEKIALTYGKDLYTFKLGIKAKPNHFSGFTYNEDTNQLYKAQPDQNIEGLPRLGTQAVEASQKLYATASFEYGRIATGDDMFLETMLKKRQESAAANANYITATSSKNNLKIGSIISIDALEEKEKTVERGLVKKNFQAQEVGQYIITEITHKATDIGEYENSFKALPAFIKKMPEPQIAFPQAQMQQAKVVDNADPKNQGRIRVQMHWQKLKNLRSPWIRVVSPDAGTSGEVPTNRGYVFIPEIGDNVMLGFRYNDPNRPIVLGSVFDGTIGKGGGPKNHLKTIFTRCGSTITFDDAQKSILIKDPSGNTWFMDGEGNITVTAPKNITMNAGENITMTAGMNIISTAGINIAENAGVDKSTIVGALHNLMVGGDSMVNIMGKLMGAIEGDIETHTKKEMVVNSQKGVAYNSEGTIDKHSQKEVKVNSAESSKQF